MPRTRVRPDYTENIFYDLEKETNRKMQVTENQWLAEYPKVERKLRDFLTNFDVILLSRKCPCENFHYILMNLEYRLEMKVGGFLPQLTEILNFHQEELLRIDAVYPIRYDLDLLEDLSYFTRANLIVKLKTATSEKLKGVLGVN